MIPDSLSLVRQRAQSAREAANALAIASHERRNEALLASAHLIRQSRPLLIEANEKDLKGEMSSAFRDRLMLNEQRIDAMAKGLEEIAALPDPLQRLLERRERPNGLIIDKISVPIGVIGIIYESRPNVTADAGGLCIKSGNAALLRGGSESQHSSAIILNCLQQGLAEAGLPSPALQALPDYSRHSITEMLILHDLIDLIIPRGGKGLIESVMAQSKIPFLAHLEGNNHTYIHSSADPAKARTIVMNAKMRRPGVCGATETLLIDREALAMLPSIIQALKKGGCELRGDAETRDLDNDIRPATEEDWRSEYLDAILAIKVVANIEEALQHISHYGSRHTEAIIAEDPNAIDDFTTRVDAAIIMVNSSTQFADGGEFGMGAEIGIATGRLHARGPVGAQELTTHKYIVRGNGQIRP